MQDDPTLPVPAEESLPKEESPATTPGELEVVMEEPAEVPETPQQPQEEAVSEEEERAQMPANEPIPVQSGPIPSVPASPPTVVVPPPFSAVSARDFALKSQVRIREKIKGKLDRILVLLQTKNHIKGGDVQKLLHLPKATATRYLNQLEREGRIIQVGTRGRGVKYVMR